MDRSELTFDEVLVESKKTRSLLTGRVVGVLEAWCIRRARERS